MEESIEESNNKKEKKNTSSRLNLQNRSRVPFSQNYTLLAETLFIKSPKHAKKIETRALLARDAPQWELLGSAQPPNPEHIVKTDPCRPKISKKDYMAPTPTWYIEQVAGPSGMADRTHGEQPCERISDSFSRGAS